MINKPPLDRMMRVEDVRTKDMTEKVLVKVLKPFKYNGEFVEEGQEIEMNETRAVNHMRVGDIERDEALIEKIKEQRIAVAQAALADSNGDW